LAAFDFPTDCPALAEPTGQMTIASTAALAVKVRTRALILTPPDMSLAVA
jgi:hypothetical protein